MVNILIGESTFNFNEAVVCLLEAESLKKSLDFSCSGDQVLPVVGVAKKKARVTRRTRVRAHVYHIYVTRKVI